MSLVEGQTYTLKETTTPDGYETAADQQFTVESGADKTIMVVDVHKNDVKTGVVRTGAAAGAAGAAVLAAVLTALIIKRRKAGKADKAE